MTIGMLLNAPYPSDVRVKKETTALLAAGFRIQLLCLRSGDEQYEEDFEGIHITRIDAGKNNYELAFWDVIMSMTFVHPKFEKRMPSWIKDNDIKILHVHDLPLVGTALAIRKKSGIPVIADFHENYPEGLRTWFEWKKNPLARLKNKIFMNANRWQKHERTAARESDHVIAVVDEMKSRIVSEHGVNPKRISVVTNSEGRDFLDQPDDPTVFKEHHGDFLVVYTGNIGPHRGVDTAITAMKKLSAYPGIKLLIIGSGSEPIMNYLRTLVAELDLSRTVYFFGRQPFSKFFSFMKYASANIIPHKSNGHTDHTVPHKLFQAMMVGKPVIVSSSAPLKRIINETKGGVIFNANDPDDLAKVILELHKSPERQSELGMNGLSATKSTYNWETDQQSLISIYEGYRGNKI